MRVIEVGSPKLKGGSKGGQRGQLPLPWPKKKERGERGRKNERKKNSQFE